MLGGISIEYSDYFSVEKEAVAVLEEMNTHSWNKDDLNSVGKEFSCYLVILLNYGKCILSAREIQER